MKYTLRRAGFTIIELVVMIVVIAILVTLATFSYGAVTDRADEKAINTELQSISASLARIKADTGAYPLDMSDVKASPEYTYGYVRINPATYCVSAAKGERSVYISSDNTIPTEGDCVDLADSITCATGYIAVPGNPLFGTDDFCVMKYEAKNVGGVPTSQAASTPWNGFLTPSAAKTAIGNTLGAGYGLITEAEWLTIAHNVLSVPTNWTGGSVGVGSLYVGHSDFSPASMQIASSDDGSGYTGTGNSDGSNQRRTLTLTNGEVIWDFAGNAWELVDAPLLGSSQPGVSGVSSYGWYDWNNSSLAWSSFPQSSLPKYGTVEAAGWASAQGIGRLYSNYGVTTNDRFFRGGDSYSNGGIFSVTYSLTIDGTARLPGFRVVFQG